MGDSWGQDRGPSELDRLAARVRRAGGALLDALDAWNAKPSTAHGDAVAAAAQVYRDARAAEDRHGHRP